MEEIMKLIIGLLIVLLSVSCVLSKDYRESVSTPSTSAKSLQKHDSQETAVKAMEYRVNTLNQPRDSINTLNNPRGISRTQPD